MEIDGTYKFSMKSPMGKVEGTMNFVTDGSVLTGSMVAGGSKAEILEGEVKENEFTFLSDLKTPMGMMRSTLIGKIEGEGISGVLKMKLGTMQFEGTKIG